MSLNMSSLLSLTGRAMMKRGEKMSNVLANSVTRMLIYSARVCCSPCVMKYLLPRPHNG